MTLVIKDDARREIQEDVDKLTQSPKYFNLKVERAKTYFPIIEKIFKEERVPDDFKYLVLQESALISDAVSTSNAVGYWQFKDFTALEVGMRVDHVIDERMNLIASTKGAATYLKKSNYMFNNWLLALQSYQMGAGGVQRSVGDKYNGERTMNITSDTYWYIKKYLAHKVAFEYAVSGDPLLKVIQYETRSQKTLDEIADEVSVDVLSLREHNKWAKNGTIPGDKSYVVLIPVGESMDGFHQLTFGTAVAQAKPVETKATPKSIVEASEFSSINSVRVIKARSGESLAQLAARGDIKLSRLLKYNDIEIVHKIKAGDYYFLSAKKKKSETDHHYALQGESLWSISQVYGVQLKRLKKYNDLPNGNISENDLVWLNTPKPEEGIYNNENTMTVEVDTESDFDWFASAANTLHTSPEIQTAKKENEASQIENISENIPPLDAPSQSAESTSSHTVESGETLYSISKLYDVPITELLSWNSLQINDGIQTGQVLVISRPENTLEDKTDTGKATYHEVEESETLYSIARQYNITIKELMDWNKKQDFSVTRGEKLIVYQK